MKRRWLCNRFVGLLPPTRFYPQKAALWRLAGVAAAADARLTSSVEIWTNGRVSIGSDSFIGHQTLLIGGMAEIAIGARCDIGPRVMLVTGTHEDGGEERAAGEGKSLPITIGDGVWIGANATVLGGVEIGEGAIIGAGSLVNRSIPPYSVAAGVPCRVIRKRTGRAHD